MRRHPARFAILVGGSIGGALDITYATVFSALRGVAPMRILQSVASGLVGGSAYTGGVPTAALGLGLHFMIAYLLAAIFYGASRRLPVLVNHPFVSGALYGAVVFAVMNLVVIPLSAFPGKLKFVPVVVASGLLVHMFCIGLPIALAARAARAAKP